MSVKGKGDGSPNGAPGSQTLARGLSVLQAVATSRIGLTAQEVADHVGVHRTIAYRLLSTLTQFRLVAKGEDGRYRSAAGLAVLGASFDNKVRQLSLPTLRALADDLGTTVSLLIAGLAYETQLLTDEAKVGILGASVLAGLLGLAYLYLVTMPPRSES